MVKDLEKLRKKPSGMTEQEMHLQLLEEAADRSNPNNEEGFFKNLHDTSKIVEKLNDLHFSYVSYDFSYVRLCF